MAKEYRKIKGSNTWHFCSNCSKWPISSYEEKPEKPKSGELCDECQAKEANNNCQDENTMIH